MNRLHVLLSLPLVAACGGNAPVPETPTPPTSTTAQSNARRDDGRGRPSVSQELGEIDKMAVETVFLNLGNPFKQCQKQGIGRIEYLAGDYKMFLRIGADGKAKYGWLEESTLGDRATEKCLLDAAFGASWPKPKGGEAEVRRQSGFTPGDAREPTDWTADRVSSVVPSNAAVKKCTSGAEGAFQVTAYVEPDGKDGKIVAAGASVRSKEAAEKVDCVVDAIKGLKTSSPGSYAAKVTFKL